VLYTRTHVHDVYAEIHTARWQCVSLGADIYKHCVVARYTQRLSFNRSLITRAVRVIGEMGIAKSDAWISQEKKVGERQMAEWDFEAPKKGGK